MAVHEIPLERRTVHGHFSPDLPPIITVDSGDSVRFPTLDAGWGRDPPAPGASERWTLGPKDPEVDIGHALVGPIAVRGASPGDVLAVRIDEIAPGPWGWTWAAGWSSELNDRLRLPDLDGHLLEWDLDADAGLARDRRGREVPLRPFLGVIGVAPAEAGIHSTMPPRRTGGNIDCKELVAGSVLFLPVAVEGALLSVGDGHAAQGDGEVSGIGIETAFARVQLTLSLRGDLSLETPIARTSDAWLTFGFDEDVDEAAVIAVNAMLDLMERELAVDRKEALALASIVVDLRITQLVNGIRGVHALLPVSALGR
jgi:acetamidase/formamidase